MAVQPFRTPMKRLFLPILLTTAAACTKSSTPLPAPEPATYRITFEATWSPATHPQAYPAGAHFSRLIGVAHNRVQGACAGPCDLSVLFRPGTLASPGLRDMAERGDNTVLRAEIQAQQPPRLAVADVFESRLPYIYSPGRFVDTVQVDGQHPLVSAVSMIAPSPDWFVALEAQTLLDEQGRWQAHLSVPARSYDAGTDSGPAFASPDQPTAPAQPVALIRSGPLAPAGSGTPLGIFHLERIR